MATSTAPAHAAKAAPPYSWARRVPPRTAATGLRGAALFVDLVALAILTYGVWLLAGRVGFLPDVGGLESYGFLVVMELPLGLLYFTVAESARGRSLGKSLIGVRVTTLNGGRPTMYQAFLRNLLRFLWMTPLGPLFLAIDLYLMATTEMDQRLGDLVSGTVVVDGRASGAND